MDRKKQTHLPALSRNHNMTMVATPHKHKMSICMTTATNQRTKGTITIHHDASINPKSFPTNKQAVSTRMILTMRHALRETEPRRYAQSILGRSSSQVTRPSVARSICIQRATGTRRMPCDHSETSGCETEIDAARREQAPCSLVYVLRSITYYSDPRYKCQALRVFPLLSNCYTFTP